MPPSSPYFERTVEDGPTIYNDQQDSTVDAHHSETSLRRRSTVNRTPPILPVSPIKKVSEQAHHKNTSMGSSYQRHFAEVSAHIEEIFGDTMTVEHKENVIFDKLSRFTQQSEILQPDLIQDDLASRGLYDQVVKMREVLESSKEKRKAKAFHEKSSMFRTPQPSFVLRDDRDITLVCGSLEAPRHSMPSKKTTSTSSFPNQHIFEDLCNLTLGGIDRLQAAPRRSSTTRRPVEVPCDVRTTAGGSPPSIPKIIPCSRFVIPDEHIVRTTTKSHSRIVIPDEPVVRSDTKSHSSTTRSGVQQLLRDVLCDVDSIPKKGCVSSNTRHLSSSAVQERLGCVRSKSVPRPRRQSDIGPQRNVTFKDSPAKVAPFCSTASQGNISQAIHANEQQLLKIVNIHFPHWRTFVRNLLNDSTVGNNVAVRFLDEMEQRRNVREVNLRTQAPADEERIYEFDRVDERILTKLREQLSRLHPSRMQQLRILQQVLRDGTGQQY